MKKVEDNIDAQQEGPTQKEIQAALAEQKAYKKALEFEVSILELEERKVNALVGINEARTRYTEIVTREAAKMKKESNDSDTVKA